MHSDSHLDKQLLQILLELLWVGGNGHRANFCEMRNIYHNRECAQLERDVLVAMQYHLPGKFHSNRVV